MDDKNATKQNEDCRITERLEENLPGAWKNRLSILLSYPLDTNVEFVHHLHLANSCDGWHRLFHFRCSSLTVGDFGSSRAVGGFGSSHTVGDLGLSHTVGDLGFRDFRPREPGYFDHSGKERVGIRTRPARIRSMKFENTWRNHVHMHGISWDPARPAVVICRVFASFPLSYSFNRHVPSQR